MELPATAPSPSPKSLIELLGWLMQAYIKAIPKQIATGIAVCGVVWLLHTFLLVGINEGFHASGNLWLNSILVLSSQVLAGTLFWLFSGIFAGQIFQGAFGKYLTGLGQLPQLLSNFVQQSQGFQVPYLWIGLSTALVFATFGSNVLVSLQTMLFVLAALNEPNHFLRLAIMLGWRDLQNVLRSQKAIAPLSPFHLQQILSGTVVGCLLASLLFLFSSELLKLIALLAVAATIFQIFNKNKFPPPNANLLLLMMIIGTAIVMPHPVWADDGGWQEAGGKFELWISSSGAFLAIVLGLPAAAGFWSGLILSGLNSTFNLPAAPSLTDLPQDIEYTYPDGRKTTLVYNPEKGAYINILTDGLIDPSELEAWHQNNLDTARRTEDWRNRNAELARTGQDAQSLALQAIKDAYLQREKEALEQSNAQKKALIEMLMEMDAAEAKREIMKGNTADSVMKVFEWIETGADVAIDFCDNLATAGGAVPGPTTVVKYVYQGVKGLASGASETYHSDIPNKNAWTYVKNMGVKSTVNLIQTGVGDKIQDMPIKGWNPFAKINDGKQLLKLPQGYRVLIKYTDAGEAVVNTTKSKTLDKLIITPVKDIFIPDSK